MEENLNAQKRESESLVRPNQFIEQQPVGSQQRRTTGRFNIGARLTNVTI